MGNSAGDSTRELEELASKLSNPRVESATSTVPPDGTCPASGAKATHRAFALLVDAESSRESFGNDHRSGHVLMPFAAEYVT